MENENESVNPIQDGPSWCCSGMRGKKVSSLQNLSHISCNDETWHTHTIPEEYPNNI